MSDVDIVLGIAVQGVEKVYNLSNAMNQLNRAIVGATNPIKNLEARSRALSSAIGSSDSSLKNHAKTISEVARNNAILTNEFSRVKKEISGLGTSYKFASGASSEFRQIAVRDLKAYEESLKSIRVRALVEDLKSLSQEQKRLGKDAQFVGRSLIIGLTTPIMGFSRFGLQSLVAIDREFVRLTKVLETVAPTADAAAKKIGVDLNNATEKQVDSVNKLVNNYNRLDEGLTKISRTYGVSKSLTVGLAGDFAELGIQVTKNIEEITELTAKTEKLGNMDIGNAKDLVQSLYFQAQRAFQQSGRLFPTVEARELAGIKAATAQLNLFNSVENVTALTLKDLGDAFPEVAAAATSFGLSMTEAAALLAPMKSAGFEVGASANSIKVSLQRLTAPTKQNAEMFKSLAKQYGTSFTEVKGTGLDAIQSLIDSFNELKDSAAGQEGAMEFFAKVFGVRQGPRMEVAIAQLAAFDKLLKNETIPATESAEKRLQGYANTAVFAANRAKNANLPVIQSFKDIGIIARIATAQAGQDVEGMQGKVTQSQINAAKEVRKKVTDEIVKAQREDQVDLIGSVATEAGRAMFIQLAGAANASEVAQRELEVSLSALDTQISILKNNFKAFASDILTSIKPAIEKISDISTTLIEKWSSLDDRTKKLISTMALIGAGATAAIGPLIFVFGQFRLAMGSIGKVLFGFLPGLKTMTIESLAARDGLLKLTKPITVMGDTVVNTNGKFATFIATLSSGDGPVSNMAKKLGEMTGVLQKTTTAPLPLVSEVMSQKTVRGALSGDPTLDPMLSGGATPAARLRRLVRTSAGIIDPLDPTARIPSAARKAFAEEEFSMEQMGLRRSGASGTRYNIEQRFGLRGRRTGFRSISAADVGEAINLRQQAFERTGITRTSPSSSLGGGRIMRLGREISEERALSIAGGGIRGRALQAYDTIGARSSSALTSSLSAIKGAPTAAVGMYQKGLLGAKEAQRLLRIETLAFTGTGPGAFARMQASVGGFAKSFGLVNNAIKLTKITLIASGIGIIILSLGVAITLVMKNMDKFKQSGASGFATIKKVLGTLKTTFESLIRPIVDLFSSFGSGADGAEGAIGGLGSAFNGLTKILEFVANVFKFLVENIIQPYLYGIVNLVKFVVNIFQGKWGDALKALAAAFANVFGGVVKLGITIMSFLVKQIINLIFEIPTAFMKAWAWGIEQATDLFFGFVEWVLGQVKRIPILGRFLGAAGGAVLGGLKNARDAYVGTVRTVANAVNSAGDTLKRGIDSGVEKAKGAVDKLAKGGVKKSKGKLDLFGGKDENSVDVDADDAQETIANQSGQGFEDGAEDGAKRIAAVLKGLKKELQQEIADRIKDTMQGVVESIQDVLKNQKESALAIYDEQIKKIEDVAKAEGRLTKEQEYQNKLREAEAERSLNRINSRRSYAMAVYAGNIDEARNIADQAARQETQDTEKINDINQDRAKEVAEQNRADLIDSIKLAKQEASKYFDDMIKSFTDAAKKITEFPPTTAEEFNTMLNQLIEGGNGFIGARAIANSMGTVFSDSFGGALSQIGVNASGPLTSSLEAIGRVLTENNPFGVNGVWNKTIDASINALTRKYQGLTNTLTTIIDTKSESFKKLFEIYKKYQSLVDTGDSTGGAGTNADTSGATGPGVGGATGGRALTRQESIALGTGLYNAGMRAGSSTPVTATPTDAVSLRTAIITAGRRAYPQSDQGVLLSKTLGYFLPRRTNENVSIRDLDIMFKNTNDSWNRSGSVANKARMVARMVLDKTKYLLNDSTYNLTPSSYYKGGIPYAMGGSTKGPVQQGIPAILHGGEYVVRNSAVKKYGWGMMQQINQGTYKPKPYAVGGIVPKGARRFDEKEFNDPAYKEWVWQQKHGGLSSSYMNAIGFAETGDAWKGIGPKWRNRVKTEDGWMGGGLAIEDGAWDDYGGTHFAKTANLATALQQMVVKNRMAVFGWIKKYAVGNKNFPAGATAYNPPLGTGGHSFMRGQKLSGKDKIPLPEHFNQELSVLSQMSKTPKSFGSANNAFINRQARDAYLRYFTKKPTELNKITMPFSQNSVWVMGKGTGAVRVPDPKGFDNFNTNFDSYAIGGLVRGNRNKVKTPSAADFRKAESQYGNWDVQRIATVAQKQINDAKKNIFQKGLSSIGGWFKKKGEENLYGFNTGKGLTGSAANLKRIENPNFEGTGTIMGLPSVKQGSMYAKNLVETGAPISGSYFSIERAMDPNLSAGQRQLNTLYAGLGLIGPTTIFSPNSGYSRIGESGKILPNIFTKAGRETLGDAYWAKKANFFNKNPELYKQYKELQDLKKVILMRKTRGMRPSSRGLLEDMSYPEYFYHQKAMKVQSLLNRDADLARRGEFMPNWGDLYGGNKVRRFFGNAYEAGLNLNTQEFSLPRSIYKTMLNPYYNLRNKINAKYPTAVKIGNEITDIKRLIKNPKSTPKKFYREADGGPFGIEYKSKTAEYFGERLGKPKSLRDDSVLGDIGNAFGLNFPELKKAYSELGISIKEKTFDLASSLIPFKRNIRGSFGTGNRIANPTPENLAILNEINQQQRIKFIRDSRIASIKDRIEKSRTGYYSGFKMSNLSSEFDVFPLNVRQQLYEMLKKGNLEKLQRNFSENMAIGVNFESYSANPADGIGNYLITVMRRATKQSDAKYLGLHEMDFIPENALFPSASFNFSVSNGGTGGGRNLNIGGIFSLADFNQTDVSKLLAFVYMNIIKKHNVTTVTNGSYSKYSYALSDRLSAMMEFLDPSVQVMTPPLSSWRPNNIEFPEMITGGKLFKTELDREIFLNNFNRIKDILAKAKVKAGEKSLLQASKEAKKAGRVPKSADEWQQAYEDYSANARNMRDMQWMATMAASSTGIDQNVFNLLSWPFQHFLQSPAGAIFMRTMRTVRNESLSPQSVLPPPIPSRIIDRIPLDEVFNGGLIRGYETGGLVKGQKNTKTPSAAGFRMADYIPDFDIQTITYNATQDVKKKKKGLWGKFTSAVTSPFRAVKNRLQKEMFGAMYGRGTGTSGSYADTFKGFTEATNDASLFNITGDSNKELPVGSIFRNRALLKASNALRVGMDFTPSGGVMAAYNAADKNRSGLSRLGWLLSSFGSMAGNTTIFAPNSGYMSGAGKGIKGVSNLQKTIQEASNVEQFFPGTRIPMPAGLRPTLSQETGRILNLIGARASGSGDVLRRETFPNAPDSHHVWRLGTRVNKIKDRYFDILSDRSRSDEIRDMARAMYYKTPLFASSAFRAASFPIEDFWRIARSSGRNFSDEQIENALSLANIRGHIYSSPTDPDLYGYSDLDRFMDALYTGRVVNRKLPTDMYKYTTYINQRQIKAEMRDRVLKNIDISKSIRMARMAGVLSSREELKALTDKMILNVDISGSRGTSYDIKTWQPLSDGSFANTSNFQFSIDPRAGSLDVGILQRGSSIGSALDVMKMLSYVYSDIMLPNNIDAISPGSTSVHSEALVIKLKEVFEKLDPRIRFISWYGDHNPTNLNDIDFDSSPYLSLSSGSRISQLAQENVFKDLGVRTRTHLMLKKIMENARGVTGESKSDIRDRIGGYANGGFVNAFASQGVPAMLHGGEYVVNSNAVKNLGIAALQAINDMRFNTPKSPSYAGPVQPQTSSTSTVHIYVDNFIGEKQWFESMMKDYNINVAPQNQKAAGLNNTTISTYRGINRGL